MGCCASLQGEEPGSRHSSPHDSGSRHSSSSSSSESHYSSHGSDSHWSNRSDRYQDYDSAHDSAHDSDRGWESEDEWAAPSLHGSVTSASSEEQDPGGVVISGCPLAYLNGGYLELREEKCKRLPVFEKVRGNW